MRINLISFMLSLVLAVTTFAQPQPFRDWFAAGGRTYCNSTDYMNCNWGNTSRPRLRWGMSGDCGEPVWDISTGGPYYAYSAPVRQQAWHTPWDDPFDLQIVTEWQPDGTLNSLAITLFTIPTYTEPEQVEVGRWVAGPSECSHEALDGYQYYDVRVKANPDSTPQPGLQAFIDYYGIAPSDVSLRVHTSALISWTPGPEIDGLFHGQVVSVNIFLYPLDQTTDIDEDGVVGVSDIFAFLSLWFAGDWRANWLGDTAGNLTDDLFAFLSDWFEESP